MRFLTSCLAAALLATLALPVSAAPAEPARAARAGTVAVELVVQAEHPRRFVLQDRDDVIAEAGGRYTVALREDGAGYVTVRAVRDDGTPGPWLRDTGAGTYVYTWSRFRAAGFRVDAAHPTIGPLRVDWPFEGLPPVPDEPIGDIETRNVVGPGVPGSVTLAMAVHDLPVGSRTVLDFYGCAGDAPVATYTSHATGFDSVLLGVDAEQLGPAGRVVVTVRRPGAPDFVTTRPVRPPTRCDAAALRFDDLQFNLAPFVNVHEIDSRNAFPVWRLGATNPLPEAAVTWRTAGQVARTRLRVGRTVAPRLVQRDDLRSFHELVHRWSVAGKPVPGRSSHLRLRKGWVGRSVTVRVTVVPSSADHLLGYHWDGSLTRTFRLGKVMR